MSAAVYPAVTLIFSKLLGTGDVRLLYFPGVAGAQELG
jgi:hypothetical protein